jgi:Tol biopolymer transport system component
VVGPVIPQGGESLLAFTSWSGDPATAGDLYVVRADGTDGRRITADAYDDWSPSWSPDGGRIAVYASDDDSVQLRVIGPDGVVRVVADDPGCFNSTQAPAWSPDGRFLLYAVDRLPDDGICDLLYTDVFVVPSDGSAPGRRLLATEHAEFTTLPDWAGDRIVLAANDGQRGALWVIEVTDADRPWDLRARRIDDGVPSTLSFGWSRWSPDGSAIATTYGSVGTEFGTALVYPMDGSRPRSLLSDPTRDQTLPAWAPDGLRLTVLELTDLLPDHGVYQLVVVGRDGSDPTVLETPDLNANGGPALVSPDGTMAAARIERDNTPVPGDVLIVGLSDPAIRVDIPADQWSSVSWQPVVNPANPAAVAPEGLPAF